MVIHIRIPLSWASWKEKAGWEAWIYSVGDSWAQSNGKIISLQNFYLHTVCQDRFTSGYSWVSLSLFFFFSLFRATPAAYRSSQLGGESELQLPAYTKATATQDPCHTCKLCCSLWHYRSLNPLRESRDRTCILTDTMSVLSLLSHNGNSCWVSF